MDTPNVSLSCAVCNNKDNVEFIKITDCLLCKKCQDDLSKSMEHRMLMDYDYPEI